MILVLDLGNTNLYVGVYQNDTLIKEYRTDSNLERSSDMYESLIYNFLVMYHYDPKDFEGAILSSVIPQLTDAIAEAISRIIGQECLIVGNNLKSGISIRTDNPSEVGVDLVCDSVGAIKKYGSPCIVCDLGTANKFVVIDKNGAFDGVVISPGIRTAQKALSGDAAQLFDITFKAPKKVVGKNTADSLNSGAIYGLIAQIEGLTKMIEKEIGYETKHILTGGNAKLIKDHVNNYIYDHSLILDGLLYIYKKNRG